MAVGTIYNIIICFTQDDAISELFVHHQNADSIFHIFGRTGGLTDNSDFFYSSEYYCVAEYTNRLFGSFVRLSVCLPACLSLDWP